MPDMKTLERKLADTRQEVRNLTVMVLNPKYSPEDRELFHLCERSCRAEAKLRRIAIEYQCGLEGLEGPVHRCGYSSESSYGAQSYFLRRDDGNVLVDAPIPARADPRTLAEAVKRVPGVVDHGFFLDLSLEVVVGGPGGARFL